MEELHKKIAESLCEEARADLMSLPKGVFRAQMVGWRGAPIVRRFNAINCDAPLLLRSRVYRHYEYCLTPLGLKVRDLLKVEHGSPAD